MSNQHDSPVPPRETTLPDDSTPVAATAPAPQTTIADGVDHRLDPRSITVQRIGGAIFTAVVAGMGLFGVLLLLVSGALSALQLLAWLGLWLVLVLAAATLSYGWPELRYRHTSYAIDDQGIRIKSGVLWRSTVTIPQSRVQHTDVQQGPLERSFDLATLIIHTAGTHHALVGLSGLAHDIAVRIRDHLIGAEHDDGA